MTNILQVNTIESGSCVRLIIYAVTKASRHIALLLHFVVLCLKLLEEYREQDCCKMVFIVL